MEFFYPGRLYRWAHNLWTSMLSTKYTHHVLPDTWKALPLATPATSWAPHQPLHSPGARGPPFWSPPFWRHYQNQSYDVSTLSINMNYPLMLTVYLEDTMLACLQISSHSTSAAILGYGKLSAVVHLETEIESLGNLAGLGNGCSWDWKPGLNNLAARYFHW